MADAYLTLAVNVCIKHKFLILTAKGNSYLTTVLAVYAETFFCVGKRCVVHQDTQQAYVFDSVGIDVI